MVHTLQDIKVGGGSIKVGSTGTISALMSRELNSSALHRPVSCKSKSPTATCLVTSGTTAPKRLKSTTASNEASSSRSNNINQESLEIAQKAKHSTRKTNEIPILNSGSISLDGTPIRGKPEKKGSYIVEIVDIKCGNPDRAWATPITNRIRKLGFSKLSDNIV
ncbi:hypothetical protein LguiA_035612 [Lonicera macranthoides]